MYPPHINSENQKSIHKEIGPFQGKDSG